MYTFVKYMFTIVNKMKIHRVTIVKTLGFISALKALPLSKIIVYEDKGI